MVSLNPYYEALLRYVTSNHSDLRIADSYRNNVSSPPPEKLRSTVSTLARRLNTLNIDYAIMGGAAVCLLTHDANRQTEDVDLVIHVDQRQITADRLTSHLLESFPHDFGPVRQFGHIIPAYKLCLTGGEEQLVELEVFDYHSWPQRPQNNLQSASRRTLPINGYPVKTFSPEWILREKILSQYQRQGPKAQTDVRDVERLIVFAIPGSPELDFSHDEELKAALADLLKNWPGMGQALKQKIDCPAIFNNWYALLSSFSMEY